MKIRLTLLIGLISFLFVNVSYAAQQDKSGVLPKKWWTMSRGKLENAYRKSAKGLEKDVVIFVGRSDSALNIDESTAIQNASMDAFQQLSRFLSQKVTGIQQDAKLIQIVDQHVKDGKLDGKKADSLLTDIRQKMSNFNASITSTQFSSFKQEDSYTEKKSGIYKGYVCYTMTNEVLKETRELQKKAFEALLEETEAYKEIMKQIQEVIAAKLLENIMDSSSLDINK